MTKQILKKLTLYSLVFALGLSPALSYAKDNESNKRGGDDNKKERVEKDHRFCLRAFGDASGNCFFPFGFGKKFRGIASSTPDTVAPVISGILIRPNSTKAKISWHTDEKTENTVFWSTSASVDTNSSSTPSVSKFRKTKNHSVILRNLTASTTYYVLIRSKDKSGNTTFSPVTSFTTKAPLPDTHLPVISQVALLVGTSTVNVKWHTNENASSKVYYSTSSNVDTSASTTSFVENTTLKQDHSLSLTGLVSQTLYYLKAESKDGSGNTTVTATFSATTE